MSCPDMGDMVMGELHLESKAVVAQEAGRRAAA